METQTIEYMKYLYLLVGKFKFDAYSQKHVVIQPNWKDQLSGRSQISKSIKLEMACVLYNLVILYLQNGAYLITFTDDDKK